MSKEINHPRDLEGVGKCDKVPAETPYTSAVPSGELPWNQDRVLKVVECRASRLGTAAVDCGYLMISDACNTRSAARPWNAWIDAAIATRDRVASEKLFREESSTMAGVAWVLFSRRAEEMAFTPWTLTCFWLWTASSISRAQLFVIARQESYLTLSIKGKATLAPSADGTVDVDSRLAVGEGKPGHCLSFQY